MRSATGFSLVEAVIATAVVGGMFVAAMTTVGASQTAQLKLSQRRQARLLAEDLVNEILQQQYAEAGTGVLGPDANEMTGTRAAFDDVDDYAGWTACPPQGKDGSSVPGLEAFRRATTVIWANPDNLRQTSSTDQGVKLIGVTVHWGSAQMAQLTAVRTSGRDTAER